MSKLESRNSFKFICKLEPVQSLYLVKDIPKRYQMTFKTYKASYISDFVFTEHFIDFQASWVILGPKSTQNNSHTERFLDDNYFLALLPRFTLVAKDIVSRKRK